MPVIITSPAAKAFRSAKTLKCSCCWMSPLSHSSEPTTCLALQPSRAPSAHRIRSILLNLVLPRRQSSRPLQLYLQGAPSSPSTHSDPNSASRAALDSLGASSSSPLLGLLLPPRMPFSSLYLSRPNPVDPSRAFLISRPLSAKGTLCLCFHECLFLWHGPHLE